MQGEWEVVVVKGKVNVDDCQSKEDNNNNDEDGDGVGDNNE